MTLNEYQQLAKRTMDINRDSEETKYHALHGMVGEIGKFTLSIRNSIKVTR